MFALALLVIGLSGYMAFAKTREGADPARSVGEAMLAAAMITMVLSGARLTSRRSPLASLLCRSQLPSWELSAPA